MHIINSHGVKPRKLIFEQPVKVYLIRHGQSEGNLSKTLQGFTDTSLTPLGEAQGRSLARSMAGIQLDAIYASDLKRAYHTAEFLAATQPGLKVVQDARLREVHGGIFERMTWEQIAQEYPEHYKNYQELSKFAPPGGENTYQCLERALDFIEEVLPQHQGQSIALVTHGFLLACLVNYCHGRSLEEAPYEIYHNTSLSEIDFYGTREFEIRSLDKHEHLKELQ